MRTLTKSSLYYFRLLRLLLSKLSTKDLKENYPHYFSVPGLLYQSQNKELLWPLTEPVILSYIWNKIFYRRGGENACQKLYWTFRSFIYFFFQKPGHYCKFFSLLSWEDEGTLNDLYDLAKKMAVSNKQAWEHKWILDTPLSASKTTALHVIRWLKVNVVDTRGNCIFCS